jgi:iron complex transport system ATP-binding protein
VISSCGKGIPIYRLLQKENSSFAAGILYENDMDYRLARLLAKEVVTEKPFEEISESALERAKELIHRCKRVIYAEFPIGTCNLRVNELVELAKEEGKLEIK